LMGGPPKVTRIAVSALYAVPYLEGTRREIPEVAATLAGYHPRPLSDKLGCHVCFKLPAKKCGKCLDVAYCSKECQVSDWKEHKKSCGIKN